MFKKVSFFLFFFIFASLLVFAQSTYDPDIHDRNFGYSLSEWATGGVFTNQIDAAFTVRNTTAGPGFSDLDRPYLFGGVDNPFNNAAGGGAATPFFSGIFIPGSLPFSFFANINHASPASGQTLTEDQGGGTIRNFDEINYSTINDQFQVLVNLGMISTGLLYVMDLDDNRPTANNYEDTGTTPNVEVNMGGSIYSHGFYVPAFLMTGMFSHYAELGFIISTTDWSVRDDSVGTNGQDFTDKLVLLRPQVIYEIMFPFLNAWNPRNQFRSRILFNFTNITYDPSGDQDGDGVTTDDSETNEYPLNFYFELNVEQALFFNALANVTMGLLPKLNFSVNKTSNGPESTTINSVTTENGEDHTITTDFTFSLASAVEFTPEDWPFGILLGVIPSFNSNVATVYDENLTAPGVTKSVTKTWTTNINHSYGLFIPIEGGYRMDITVGAVGLWDFDNLSLQLVVPLK